MSDAKNRPPRKGIRKGVYVVPSLFTIGNIFCGFYAVIHSMKGYQLLGDTAQAKMHFDYAALAIGIAYLLDGLDGRIARLTDATSEFGVELDSIADVISFGLAPAVLAFTWGYGNLQNHDQIAWAVSFFFLICGALRLARFNVLSRAPRFEAPGATPKLDKKYFVGLPIPAPAGLIAAVVHFMPTPLTGDAAETKNWLILGIVLTLAVLMVSTFRYASFKDFGPQSNHPFLVIPFLAALIICIVLFSQWTLLILATIYCSHGVILKLWSMIARPRKAVSPKELLPDENSN